MSTTTHSFTTAGHVEVSVATAELPYGDSCSALIGRLDNRRGLLFSSGMEAPGRYTRWDMGFADPPLVLTAIERRFSIDALNERGRVLLPAFAEALSTNPDVLTVERAEDRVAGEVRPSVGRFREEDRSRQPSIFSVVRTLRDLLGSREDDHLGLYGAFGYDIAYQFEPVERRIPRPADGRDLVLYLPDELIVVDHARRRAERRSYDFAAGGRSTTGLPRETEDDPYLATAPLPSPLRGGSSRAKPDRDGGGPGGTSTVATGGGTPTPDPSPQGGGERAGTPVSDHEPGEYAATVRRAQEAFARGDLFEVVPGQTFRVPCPDAPSAVFRRLTAANPAPYGGLINLGQGEFLVAASPEMYVRVRGSRVETCPISGTIARGRDAFEDADQIRALLASSKDEAELTMCTDVDRNDKARICEPGSVKVLARRQIETYSRLFHTVDHVEGLLRPEMDALDAFLSHAWAVTVTGAPKSWAMDFIEQNERSARRWYGGAIGRLTFDGNLDTGITIRTARLKDGSAEVRAGATLLHDSDPDAEDSECALKASAMLASVTGAAPLRAGRGVATVGQSAGGRRVLLVDFKDSFVHNLADYLRQTGAHVTTFRHNDVLGELDAVAPDLLVLSPGPGRPADFGMDRIIAAALKRGLPVFGVCLGLQGLVEHFGGTLDQLDTPVHGKPSEISVEPSRLFAGVPERLVVGRYHSLHARAAAVPNALRVVARTRDGIVMAVEHAALPIAAVQFHPESILSARGDGGLALIETVIGRLLAGAPPGRLSIGQAGEPPGSEAARHRDGPPPAAAAVGA